MENIALIESFSEFKDEKFIDRVTLMAILEEVFRNTITKQFGTDENFDISEATLCPSFFLNKVK